MSNGQSSPGWVKGYIPTAGEWNGVFAGKVDASVPIVSASASLVISKSGDYGYTGSAPATWMLPLLSTGIMPVDVINMGSANLTLNCAGRDTLYNGGFVSTQLLLNPGDAFSLRNFSIIWAVE